MEPGVRDTGAMDMLSQRTGNQVTKEPCYIVPSNPLQEREQVVKIAPHRAPRGSDAAQPFADGGFLFDVGIGARDGEDGFASRQVLRPGGIAIVQFDPQHFGQAMTNFGPGARLGRSHTGSLHAGRCRGGELAGASMILLPIPRKTVTCSSRRSNRERNSKRSVP